jgi:hypothetical protein
MQFNFLFRRFCHVRTAGAIGTREATICSARKTNHRMESNRRANPRPAKLLFQPSNRKEHLAVRIVTVEMGTVAIKQALQAISDLFDTPQKEAIDWAAQYFDRLREYRNYFIHDITLAVPSSDLGPLGIIIMMRAKVEAAQDKDFSSIKQVDEMAGRAITLRTYIGAILNNLAWGPGHPVLAERPRVPVLPPMPEKLKKTRSYLLRP